MAIPQLRIVSVAVPLHQVRSHLSNFTYEADEEPIKAQIEGAKRNCLEYPPLAKATSLRVHCVVIVLVLSLATSALCFIATGHKNWCNGMLISLVPVMAFGLKGRPYLLARSIEKKREETINLIRAEGERTRNAKPDEVRDLYVAMRHEVNMIKMIAPAEIADQNLVFQFGDLDQEIESLFKSLSEEQQRNFINYLVENRPTDVIELRIYKAIVMSLRHCCNTLQAGAQADRLKYQGFYQSLMGNDTR